MTWYREDMNWKLVWKKLAACFASCSQFLQFLVCAPLDSWDDYEISETKSMLFFRCLIPYLTTMVFPKKLPNMGNMQNTTTNLGNLYVHPNLLGFHPSNDTNNHLRVSCFPPSRKFVPTHYKQQQTSIFTNFQVISTTKFQGTFCSVQDWEQRKLVAMKKSHYRSSRKGWSLCLR